MTFQVNSLIAFIAQYLKTDIVLLVFVSALELFLKMWSDVKKVFFVCFFAFKIPSASNTIQCTIAESELTIY